ncbi:MAG: methyltransferase domain-containing protein [Verrucomicrobia bacterium]|nr:methyltransferase domain-containing protein [Verrucomicrobiota bacterium]
MKSTPTRSLPPEYFDGKYAEKLDYWDFASSTYEALKYADTLRSLPARQYRNAFEIGCSIGVLTAQLATRSNNLLAIDVADRALAAARTHCVALSNVHIAKMQFPNERPPESARFDLIIVSEVGYYWSCEEFSTAQAAIEEQLEAGGHLVLVHWTPVVLDYPLTGDQVHESFRARPSLKLLHGHRATTYRLDVLEKRSR